MSMILFDSSKGASIVKIKAFGVGGGGCNAVDYMINQGMDKKYFCSINTDQQSLSVNKTDFKLPIGVKLTGGSGAGANPAIGRQAAEESIDAIHDAMEDVDICIIIAGMGGGTGTGAAPIVASAARQQGKTVIAFVTTPFEFEGKYKKRNAFLGIDELKEHAHSLIVISNDKIHELSTEDTSFKSAFNKVDNILMEAVNSLIRLIVQPGMINIDFADLRAVLSIGGNAVITYGFGMGVNRALNAIDAALSNVLLESGQLKGARGLLVNVVGGEDLTLFEVTNSMRRLTALVNENANIIFGANIDHTMNEKVMVSIIATGIDNKSDDVSFIESSSVSKPAQKPKFDFNIERITPCDEGSSMFQGFINQDLDDSLDIPTFIRRNKRITGFHHKDVT